MYCGNCGHKLDEGAKWCGNCGSPCEIYDTATCSRTNNIIDNSNGHLSSANSINSGSNTFLNCVMYTLFIVGIVALIFAIKDIIGMFITGFFIPYPFSEPAAYIEDVVFSFFGYLWFTGSVSFNNAAVIVIAIMSMTAIMLFYTWKKYPKNYYSLTCQSTTFLIIGCIFIIGAFCRLFEISSVLQKPHFYITIIGGIVSLIFRIYLVYYFVNKIKMIDSTNKSKHIVSKIIFGWSVFLIIVAVLDLWPVLRYIIFNAINIFNAPVSLWASIPLAVLCFGAGFSGIKISSNIDWCISTLAHSVTILLSFIALIPSVILVFFPAFNTSNTLGGFGLAINAMLIFILVVFILMIVAPIVLIIGIKKIMDNDKV